MSVVLLVVSGLLLRALWRIESGTRAFEPRVLSAADVAADAEVPDDGARAGVSTTVFFAVRAQPGVTSAAYISFLPMTCVAASSPSPSRAMRRIPRRQHMASIRYITPGFFAALDIPIRAGRDVRETDTRMRLGRCRQRIVCRRELARRVAAGPPVRHRVSRTRGRRVGGRHRRARSRTRQRAASLHARRANPDGTCRGSRRRTSPSSRQSRPPGSRRRYAGSSRDADPDQPVSRCQTLETTRRK